MNAETMELPPGRGPDLVHKERIVLRPIIPLKEKEYPMRALVDIRGIILSLAATILSLAVVFYFYLVVIVGQAPDYNLQVSGKVIPPESYSFILLSLWTLMQRINTRWGMGAVEGKLGTPFAWKDTFIDGLGVAAFMVFILGKALSSDTNMTFIIVIIAFLLSAFGDFILNLGHRSAANPTTIRLTAGASQEGASAAVEVSNEAVEIPVVFRPIGLRINGNLIPLPRTIELSTSEPPRIINH